MVSGKSCKFKKKNPKIIFPCDVQGVLMGLADKILTMMLANKEVFREVILNAIYHEDESFEDEDIEALYKIAGKLDYYMALEKIWKEDKDE
jgi:hypothetical protein